MQMLKKIFNSDSKYYLELDEIKESKPVQAVVETAEKVADAVQDKASEVLESEPAKETVETAKKTAKKAKDEAQSKLKSTTETESKPQAKSKADSKFKANQNGKAAQVQQNEKAKPSPQNAGASSDEPPFWVAAMYNNSTSDVNIDGQKAEQTFATDNLMPTITKYRRRPGPSLSKFKDMASKAKTPKG